MQRFSHPRLSTAFRSVFPRFLLLTLVPLLLSELTGSSGKRAFAQSDDVFLKSGVTGGFVVEIGSVSPEFTASLRRNSGTQVQTLLLDEAAVDEFRNSLKSKAPYGEVSAMEFRGPELPYIDNLVNLLIVHQQVEVPRDELLRVLVPNGVLLERGEGGSWISTVKPRPDTIDDWSHYLHDSTGNAVAHDKEVAPPRHLQWVGSPRWSRHHDRMASMSALVSTNGRMFYVMDEGSRISIQLPSQWKLIARDAFNGTILWKREIANWQNHLWPLKSGPTQLSRRLVSTDNEVYATLAFDAPLTALDAATGQTLRTYEGSDATEEIILRDGLLFLVVRKEPSELTRYVPLNGTVGDQALVGREFFWNEEPRVIMAIEAATGKQLWAKQSRVSPLTLAADDKAVYFHDGERLVSMNPKTGESNWISEPLTRRRQFTFNFGPRLVLHSGVVLYAGGDGRMFSLDAESGKQLWTADHPNSGYQSPQDLIVLDNLVWCAPTTSGKDTGVYTGRDLRTGEVRKEFAPDIDTYWFHHRCYIAKATDNFLIPSRTGVEFVSTEKEHWDIHHWVRGGCLYGIMPCNGLTYTPPHNCACYPEAKLFGFNALAPMAPSRPIPAEVPEAGRLIQGPAFDSPLKETVVGGGEDDWPTLRHDSARSGASRQEIDAKVGSQWTVTLGGRLTSPVITEGSVFVAQTDAHTLHSLDAATGASKWSYTASARIDSPPTVVQGRVLFGGTDGWVYCLRSSDGLLIWKYRAAPLDRRTMAFEQLESVWPVHGSVLVRDRVVYCVAGRSNFLDGGLRLLRLDLLSGTKLSETVMDETNPATGNNMQEVLKVLQMPVGLPDILSADDKFVYMKSQKFDFEGNRLEIGPNSGDFVEQASVQRGPGVHLFAPMGFLDDSWFHRSYWVFGRSFAGGHGGYYQAGKFAPSGEIMVQGDGYVYGYGRKPEYLRWTTTLERQLFAASPTPPEIPKDFGKAAASTSIAQFPKVAAMDPAGKPITVEAWVSPIAPKGVIVARGGPAEGFALTIENGKPSFHVRSSSQLSTVTGKKRIVGGWHHVAGVLTADLKLRIYVDGVKESEVMATALLTKDPAQGFDIGDDSGTAVGEYKSPSPFGGIIDEVRLYFSTPTDEQVADRYRDGAELGGDPALVVTFDDGTARDLSVNRINGTLIGGKPIEGKFGQAVQFTAKGAGAKAPESLVKPKWTADVPIYVRGMVLAGSSLFIVGPPDLIDEESTFKQLSERDQQVQEALTAQHEALNGSQGSILLAVNIDTGETLNRTELTSLPSWDGLSGAYGKLFLTTLDGKVMCFGK